MLARLVAGRGCGRVFSPQRHEGHEGHKEALM